MQAWRSSLRGDPLPWLLERDDPAVCRALKGAAPGRR